MKKLTFLLAAGIIILTTGCSGYLPLSVEKGYQKYLDSPVSLKIDKKANEGSIRLTIVSTDQCGCYLEKANEKQEISQKVPYQCLGFPLYTDDPGKEIKKKAQADNVKSRAYYVFESYGQVAKLCLERHLQPYFTNVKVDLTSPDQTNPSPASAISYYSKFSVTSDKFLLTKLIAVSDKGKTYEGVGEVTDKMGNGNLAWYVPISIVFFPLGYAICTTILNNKHNEVIIRTAAWSVDKAAADLSKKIAEDIAQNLNQNFTVYLLIE
jgi:hypothetical protein